MRSGFAVVAIVAWAGAGVWPTPAAAEEFFVFSRELQDGERTNPFTSAEDVAAGARVFRTGCALCHGGDAKGGIGPDLTLGRFRHGSSDAALFRNIITGIPGTDMAGVYRPDTEIWQVVAYIRSLAAGADQVVVPGNPGSGEAIYRTKGACVTCHRVDGEGSRLGPDLSAIGWKRSPAHIEASLVRPDEFIPFSFRQVELTTRQGERIAGRLINESEVAVQLMDTAESLRTFMKADLVSFEKPTASMMPGYGETFSGSEIQDLVAYLYSLKGDQ